MSRFRSSVESWRVQNHAHTLVECSKAHNSSSIQLARLKKAVCWVVIVILGVLGILFVSNSFFGKESVEGLGDEYSSLVEALMDSPKVLDEDVLAQAGLQTFDSNSVPSWFASEFFDPAIIGSGIATKNWDLVGVSSKGLGEDTFQSLVSLMEAKGWRSCSTDGEVSRSFVKQEGRCRWATVSYTQVGDAVNIVLRIQHS